MLYNGHAAPQPPKFYSRIRTFIYGCAVYAEQDEGRKVTAIGRGVDNRVAKVLGGK